MTLGEMKYRLVCDVLCWIGLTIVLLHFNCPNAAAVIGAFGIVYTFLGTRLYLRTKKQMIEDMLNGRL